MLGQGRNRQPRPQCSTLGRFAAPGFRSGRRQSSRSSSQVYKASHEQGHPDRPRSPHPVGLIGWSFVQRAPAQVAIATIATSSATSPTYDELYTESTWQRVQLSPEVLARLGRLNGLHLSAVDLPGSVIVAISSRSGPGGTLGLNITRTDKGVGVHQTGTFTLTNPASGERFTFLATVNCSGR